MTKKEFIKIIKLVLFDDVEDGGFGPIQYSREDGTDDDIAEALAERLLYVGFEL